MPPGVLHSGQAVPLRAFPGVPWRVSDLVGSCSRLQSKGSAYAVLTFKCARLHWRIDRLKPASTQGRRRRHAMDGGTLWTVACLQSLAAA